MYFKRCLMQCKFKFVSLSLSAIHQKALAVRASQLFFCRTCSCPLLLALLVANLLKLAHGLLLARVADQTYPVDPSLLALPITINHEDD